jgi:hypothetical protein
MTIRGARGGLRGRLVLDVAYLCAALVAVLVAYLDKLVLEHAAEHFVV